MTTLQSVLCQTEPDFEIVIVNDGSTDRSVQVVEKIVDKRIRLFNQKNGGPSMARNTGINEAKGDWVIFLDADDELMPDTLSTFKYLIEKYPEDKCFTCNFYSERDGRKKINSFLYFEKRINKPFWAWSFGKLLPVAGSSVFHKDITTNFRFNENYKRYEDADWLFRIMREHRFIRYPKPVMIYHLDSAEASRKRNDISVDFIGNLDLFSGTTGEKLAKYQLFKQAQAIYPEEVTTVYTELWNHSDSLLLKFLDQASVFSIRTDRLIKRVVQYFLDLRN